MAETQEQSKQKVSPLTTRAGFIVALGLSVLLLNFVIIKKIHPYTFTFDIEELLLFSSGEILIVLALIVNAVVYKKSFCCQSKSEEPVKQGTDS